MEAGATQAAGTAALAGGGYYNVFGTPGSDRNVSCDLRSVAASAAVFAANARITGHPGSAIGDHVQARYTGRDGEEASTSTGVRAPGRCDERSFGSARCGCGSIYA